MAKDTDSDEHKSTDVYEAKSPSINEKIMEICIQALLNQKDNAKRLLHINHYTTGVILYGSREQIARQGLAKSRNPEQLTVLTWNIDGLDPEDGRERLKSLLLHLGKYRADVVLLQELVSPILMVLKEVMTDYEFLQGSNDGYFTGILLRRCRINLVQNSIVKYPTTEMGRNLLMAEVNLTGHQICFMTSHLESLKANSQERLNQLRRVWKRMREAPDSQTVIFGGDTNLRDWEMKKLGGLPDGITDVWEVLGEPEDCKYTWDTVNNNNKEIPFSARLRFDRVYMRAAREGAQLRPDTMTLDYQMSWHFLATCFCSDQRRLGRLLILSTGHILNLIS
ncbi:tyrosyl-DNA phosphodiesterase 2-like isoform X1 [Clarias magur]|uniref:Tyrosyl-DNA phosphodiesterase 2 n=1 Tax=Clarias magur TaxID=1594786 RepID=A0A8J4X8L1_CLAMG|nr:tyrosyl-DNA phosphodiesterase 2-like isoform X1 [Clarias magur]